MIGECIVAVCNYKTAIEISYYHHVTISSHGPIMAGTFAKIDGPEQGVVAMPCHRNAG
jgi:hypothetical protein